MKQSRFFNINLIQIHTNEKLTEIFLGGYGQKWVSNMLGSNKQGDGVINQHLLSRNASGVTFNFIPHMALEIPRR